MKYIKYFFYVGLLAFIGFQLYKWHVSNKSYCQDVRVKNVNEKIFDFKYVYVPEQDIYSSYDELTILNFYFHGCFYSLFAREEENLLSDEVKRVTWDAERQLFTEFDKIGRYTKLVQDNIDYTLTIEPRYSESGENTVCVADYGSSNYRFLRKYVYNKYGYVKEYSVADGSSDFVTIVRNEYDDEGRLLECNSKGNETIVFKYLDNDEAEVLKYKDSTKTEMYWYSHFDHFGFLDSMYYKYDENGIEKHSFSSVYTTYSSGRLESKTVIKKGVIAKQIRFREDGKVLSYDDFQDKNSLEWEYDIFGRLVEYKINTKVVHKYKYGWNGSLEQIEIYRDGRLDSKSNYDRYGNKLEEISYKEDGSVRYSNTWQYEYF